MDNVNVLSTNIKIIKNVGSAIFGSKNGKASTTSNRNILSEHKCAKKPHRNRFIERNFSEAKRSQEKTKGICRRLHINVFVSILLSHSRLLF